MRKIILLVFFSCSLFAQEKDIEVYNKDSNQFLFGVFRDFNAPSNGVYTSYIFNTPKINFGFFGAASYGWNLAGGIIESENTSYSLGLVFPYKRFHFFVGIGERIIASKNKNYYSQNISSGVNFLFKKYLYLQTGINHSGDINGGRFIVGLGVHF